jgi:hypothetical protein
MNDAARSTKTGRLVGLSAPTIRQSRPRARDSLQLPYSPTAASTTTLIWTSVDERTKLSS